MLRSFKMEALEEDIAAAPERFARFAALSGRTLSGTTEEFASGFMSKIPGFDKANEASYRTVTRQAFALWQRKSGQLQKAGMTELEADVAAMEVVASVYPAANATLEGQSDARAALLRALPTSYSFITKPAELMGESTVGFAKLIAGQKLTPKERLSTQVMATMAASALVTSVVSAALSGLAKGEDKDQILQDMKDAINPDPYNGKFLSIIIGDKRIPIGGPYRAIFRALYPQDVDGIPFPVPFAGLPDYLKNRINPVLGTQLDLILNKDYSNKAILTGDTPDKILRGLLYEVEGALPLSAGAAMESVRHGDTSDQLIQNVLSQFMGANVITLNDTYFDRLIKKLGQPEGEQLEFSNERPVYDVKDIYGDVTSVVKVSETNNKIRYPDIVKSILAVRALKVETNKYPGMDLYNINADVDKGDTFVEYYEQWQAIQSGKADPKDYPQAYLGNMTRQQYDLLVQYHALETDAEREQFKLDHPEITVNPRVEYLKSHPEENAQLALWGQAPVYTKAAYDKVTQLANELDIPDSALVGRLPQAIVSPYFEYQDVVDQYKASSAQAKLYRLEHPEFDAWLQDNEHVAAVKENINALKITVQYAEQDKVYNAMTGSGAKTAYLVENPTYAEARYTRDAWNKGYSEEWVDDYVQYRESVELRGVSRKEYYWMHPQFYQQALKVEGIEPVTPPRGPYISGMGYNISLGA